MAQQGEGDLREFAREHHVHYELEPELMGEGDARAVVGVDVRLFAMHAASKLETPACPRCMELATELRSFAEQVVSAAGAGGRSEVVPPEPVLYESQEVRGADEVPLTVRVRFGEPVPTAGATDDERVRELRERLEALGVPRR